MFATAVIQFPIATTENGGYKLGDKTKAETLGGLMEAAQRTPMETASGATLSLGKACG